MNKQINEPFNDDCKSEAYPEGLIFRLAEDKDVDSIYNLMFARNPHLDAKALRERTRNEVLYNSTDERYRVFVAELDNKVAGFCRFFHSEGIKKEKPYKAPEGYYCMGTIVNSSMRRKNIGRFLSDGRFDWLKEHGVEVVYSGVAGDNPASLRMHEKFGYQNIKEVKGFHHISFDCGHGFLFRKDL